MEAPPQLSLSAHLLLLASREPALFMFKSLLSWYMLNHFDTFWIVLLNIIVLIVRKIGFRMTWTVLGTR